MGFGFGLGFGVGLGSDGVSLTAKLVCGVKAKTANPTAPAQSNFEMPDFSMRFSRLFPVANPDRRSKDYTIAPRPEVTGA